MYLQSIMNIDNQNIPRIVERFVPTANSLNQYSIYFTYSNPVWEELSKYATFTNNQGVSEQAIVTNDIVIIPQSVLSGVGDVSLVTMTLFGINATDRWTTKEIGIYVNQNNFQPVQIIDDPDVWQQYLFQMENYVNEANDAVDKANEAIAKYPYIGSDNFWYVWDVTSGEYINTGVLADNAYALPMATDAELGGVKIGDNININADGQVSVDTTKIATVEYVDDEVSDLDTKIRDETTLRENADTTLQDNIDTNTTNISTNTDNIATNKANIATNTDDILTKLPLSGGTMTGDINMANFTLDNLASATLDGQPCTFKQLNDAIAGLGTVFNLKGSVATIADLPTSGNTVGDVYYVEAQSVGYIWLEDTTGTLRWEKFGETIDLSGYLTKAGLLTTTGSATDNTMSQSAITTALGTKVDKVTGKQLSTNDFTDILLTKLNGLSNYDDTAVLADIQELQTDVVSNTTQIALKANITTVTALSDTVDTKANSSDVYTKTQANSTFATPSDITTAISNQSTLDDAKYLGISATAVDSDKLGGKEWIFTTYADYEALTDAEKQDSTKVYLYPEEE